MLGVWADCLREWTDILFPDAQNWMIGARPLAPDRATDAASATASAAGS
jgi:hypothetical protein